MRSKVIAGLLVAAIAACAAAAADAASVTSFDKGWKFLKADAPGAEAPSFDDSAWRTVDVPHDWSIELLPTNASGTGTSGGTGYLQGGLGWYRKTFTLPRSMAGKKISIDFDGVYMDSYEYLNGTLLGNHPYGYTGFAFDVTNLVHTDGVTPNVLAVVVQNQLPSSRWYSSKPSSL